MGRKSSEMKGECIRELLAGESIRVVAKKYGLPYSTVASWSARLGRENKLTRNPTYLRFLEDNQKPISQDNLVTLEGRLEWLRTLASQRQDSVGVRAIEVIDEITKQMGVGAGPPPPRTPDEMCERLTSLNKGVGRDIAERAFKEAYPPQAESQGEKRVEAGAGDDRVAGCD